jgi:ABC-type sugar transport system ATPase subunit
MREEQSKAAGTTLLKMSGIDKSFPGVKALSDVDLEVRAGEVLALIGENGAGKSTLIKVLGGAHTADKGGIFLDGKPISIRSPLEARRAGVGIIYQEFNLVPGLSTRENIFLGEEKTRAGFVDQRTERREAKALFDRIGVSVDPDALCKDLSVAQQQVVEIAKALSLDAKIIVMDEPSATLTPQEVERLFVIIRDLKAQGIAVIYISHRLDELFQIADRIMVMRDGAHVGDCDIGDIDRHRLIEMMVGRSLENEFPKVNHEIGDERLVVRKMNRGKAVRDVSFTARAGEILAFAGLVGAGRTEAMRLVFGADKPDSGSVELDGKTLRIRSPRDAIRAGIGLLTEDRKSQGLVLIQSVRENFGLPNLAEFSSAGFVSLEKESNAFSKFVESLQIKIPHQEQHAGNLSGGNQQKVVLAKWLQRNCEVIIFDEPTRGIDVGTKYDIYLLMNELAAQGKVVIMISSELPEVLGMADRIIVMHEGRISGEIQDMANASQEQIMKLAVQ